MEERSAGYAAYDQHSIYGIGRTPEAAIADAQQWAGPEAEFDTAPIRADLYQEIHESGWDGMRKSFEVDKEGYLVDTTGNRHHEER